LHVEKRLITEKITPETSMKDVRIILLTGTLAALLGCSGGYTTSNNNMQPPPPPSGNPVQAVTVDVQDNFFSPQTVLIVQGGTVTWNWVGSGHSVTSSGNPSFSPNAPVSNAPRTLGPVTFSVAGTYQYYCLVHGVAGVYGGGSMTGVVYVQ
jgi:plastocyanin